MADVKEGVKFTEEEMQKINEFKGIYDTITISYGRLAMDKLVLEDTEKVKQQKAKGKANGRN